MRRLPAIAALVGLASVLVAGCGGSSDAPRATAQQFVAAVTHDDRGTWCGQVGEAFLVANRPGGLVRQLLSQCKSSDLFAVTGACDREGVISGSSVTGDSVHGDRADVHLSSGATLELQHQQDRWYVTSISGGAPQHIQHGLCAGAGGG